MSIRATGHYWLNSMISQPEIFLVNLKKYLRIISAFICWDAHSGDSQHPGNVFQRANITFSGAPDRDNPDYLSVQSETENLAIEIYDSKGQQIHLGEPSPDYVLNPGKNTLKFTAYLISRDGRMTSGEFTAVTHFVVNYL